MFVHFLHASGFWLLCSAVNPHSKHHQGFITPSVLQTVFVEWVTQEGQKKLWAVFFISAVFLFWKGEAGKPQSFQQRAQHPQPPPPPSSSPSPPSSPAGPDQIFCQSAKCSCHLVAATLSPPKKESTEFLVDVITTITITAITITVATWWS